MAVGLDVPGRDRQPKPRPDLTAAVLLWAWDSVLVNGGDTDNFRGQRACAAAKSELRRLGLIDELGTPTKEGRRMLGLI